MSAALDANAIEVAMPIGLYTSCEVSAPCGLCSPQGIIGLLDVPGTFLDPDRMNAGLMWFTRGFVEYQFPNNARLVGKAVTALEFSLELSSEVPGTSADWPSDITVAINGREVGAWTSPGDFGDQRGALYARLVEAEGQPIRHAEELARDAGRRVRRRHEDLVDDARRTSTFPATIRSGSGSRSSPTRAIPAASTFSAAASAITIRTSSCG